MAQSNETFKSRKILSLLSRSLPYYLKSWQEFENGTGLFGNTDPKIFNMRDIASSSPVIEYVVRPHMNILCTLASFVYNNSITVEEKTVDHKDFIDKIQKGLLWMCESHITGSMEIESFLERKCWGENWRSGLWAALMGVVIYLMGGNLSKDIAKKAGRVIAYEADRFIDVLPPSGCDFDTKLEENAQDSMVLAWAINILPEDDHAKDWERTLNIWAVNIATSVRSKADHSPHLGKSISHWVTTRTLFPDMTAENHGFFNPEILSYGMWVVLSMAAFRFHDREIPEIFQRKNHQEAFDILLRFCLPSGVLYAPGSSDFPLFIPHPFALAWGLWNNDPRAQRITSTILNWMNNKLKPVDENAVPWVHGFLANYEGWELLFQSQVGFELALLSVIPFPKEHRFYSMGQVESAVDTKHIYPYVEVCYRRNTRITRSVAWKALSNHPVVGLNIHSYTELLVPHKANLLGIPKTSDRIKTWEVAWHNDFPKKDGFDTSGRIDYYNKHGECLLKRDVRVITWGDDGVIIFDKIIANKECKFQEQFLSPLYLVNDVWTKYGLEINSGSLRVKIDAEDDSGRAVPCPSFWVSVEGSVLLQLIWGQQKGLTFIPGNRRNAPQYWKNCRLDMVGILAEEKLCGVGDVVYEVGFYVGAGKGPRPFKTSGKGGEEFFKGIVVMDGRNTFGLG